MNQILLLFVALAVLVNLSTCAILMSYPSYQTSGWHYDNYGNLMLGNRNNGFYLGPCMGPECPWGK